MRFCHVIGLPWLSWGFLFLRCSFGLLPLVLLGSHLIPSHLRSGDRPRLFILTTSPLSAWSFLLLTTAFSTPGRLLGLKLYS